jgi:very-short-patch-repair endonuclease
MSILIFINKMENIKTEVVDGETWYKLGDVADVLGYKNIRDQVRIVPKSERRLIMTSTTGGKQKCGFVNKAGLKRILLTSRKPAVIDLCKEIGIDITNHKYECKESESIGAMLKVFEGEKMRTQHPVLNYRVDLYFPDYNLVVECDEKNHTDRDAGEERRRQRRITKKIKCQWLRYNPDAKDFNLFQVMNQIFTIIKSKS